MPPFSGSKNLRDVENGVKIEFLISGDYPGDGKPKPVCFPDPAQAGAAISGISYLTLPKLIELKLASGLTNILRLKDLADVQELIKSLNLSLEFAERLDPFVRDEFTRLWRNAQPAPTTRFLMLLSSQPKSFEELIAAHPTEADKFRAMR